MPPFHPHLFLGRLDLDEPWTTPALSLAPFQADQSWFVVSCWLKPDAAEPARHHGFASWKMHWKGELNLLRKMNIYGFRGILYLSTLRTLAWPFQTDDNTKHVGFEITNVVYLVVHASLKHNITSMTTLLTPLTSGWDPPSTSQDV